MSEFFTVSEQTRSQRTVDAQAKASTIFSHLLIEADIQAGMIAAVRCKTEEEAAKPK
jgi:hypothetical protein